MSLVFFLPNWVTHKLVSRFLIIIINNSYFFSNLQSYKNIEILHFQTHENFIQSWKGNIFFKQKRDTSVSVTVFPTALH